jgi:hypothetical protein
MKKGTPNLKRYSMISTLWKLKKKYGNDKGVDSLIEAFNKSSLKGESQKDRQWRMFGKGAISAAIFLSDFKGIEEFDGFVNDFQRNNYSRDALPMLLAKEIVGFGFALACDFLKEARYVGYAKPDSHLMYVFEQSGLCKRNDYERFDYEVFKTIICVAEAVGKTPYEVDKRIWLVCTGKFYYDEDVADKKEKLIRQLSE